MSKAPYTAQEKRYLRRLHGWLGGVGAAAFATHGPAHDDLLKGKIDDRLRPALRVLSTCAARLSSLGTPPTQRLRYGAKASSHVDQKLSDAVATAFDMSTEVHCWSESDWPKIVDESNAFSSPSCSPVTGSTCRLCVCGELADLVYRHERPTSGDAALRAAEGLVVLTHEAEHVSGVAVEAEAECYAMQDAADDGIELGLKQPYARQLSTLYWREIYPNALPAYRSSECRTNGRLDLYSDNLWP